MRAEYDRVRASSQRTIKAGAQSKDPGPVNAVAKPSAISSTGPRALTRPASRARIVSPGLRGASEEASMESWERTLVGLLGGD